MCSQEFGNPVTGQDGMQRWPVFWVCLEHLLDQILQLIGQMIGEGRVRTPTHLKNQALPAGRLELDTRIRCVSHKKNTHQIIQFSWRYWTSIIPQQCSAVSHCATLCNAFIDNIWTEARGQTRGTWRVQGGVIPGVAGCRARRERSPETTHHCRTQQHRDGYSFTSDVRHVLAQSTKIQDRLTHAWVT